MFSYSTMKQSFSFRAYIQCFSPHSAHYTHKHTTSANTTRLGRLVGVKETLLVYWVCWSSCFMFVFRVIHTLDSFYLYWKKITENPFDGLGSLHFFLGWLRTWAWNCYYFEGKIWFLLHSLEEKRTTKIEWRWIERSSIVLLLFRILIFLLEL